MGAHLPRGALDLKEWVIETVQILRTLPRNPNQLPPESLSSGARQYSTENFYPADLVILKIHLDIHIYRPCFVINRGVQLSPYWKDLDIYARGKN